MLRKKINLLNISRNDIVEILKNKKLLLIPNEQPYDYLIKMPFYSFTKEKINELQDELAKKEILYKKMKDKNIEDMWLDDLNALKTELCKNKLKCVL